MEMYHKLTDESKEHITEYVNKCDLEGLLDFINNGVNVVAGIHAVRYMENLVKKYGVHVLINSCSNCQKTTTCDAPFALNVCGEGLLEWEEKV